MGKQPGNRGHAGDRPLGRDQRVQDGPRIQLAGTVWRNQGPDVRAPRNRREKSAAIS